MARKIKIVGIGDVHWGAVPPERLEREFDEVVFPWLADNEFDALIQFGDWYDKRLSLDSEDAKAAMRVAVRLCQLCHARGVPFRIIKGTLSHDYFQLENLRPLETEYPEFRIIGSAQHEELLEGFDVLWMPEEYPQDYGDYYGQLLFDEDGNGLVYDAIFGHGEIDVAAGWSQMNEGERHYGGTPCHAAETLMDHSSGPVWFGHVHARFRYKKRLGYPGSFTRWCHGEQDPKGFDVIELTQAKTGWTVKSDAVLNELAPEYRTVSAAELFSPADTTDAIVAAIREAGDSVHKLRVKLDTFQLGVEELSIVRGAFASDPTVEIQATARVLAERVGEEAEGVEAEDDGHTSASETTLSYLRDPTLTGEERLLRYMQDKNPECAAVTLDEVRELTAPLA